MRNGRPPKSIEQHKAEGTLRTARHAAVPLISGKRIRPRCPDALTGRARDIFREIVGDLWASRIIDRMDRTMILAAALHLATALDAQDMVAKLGTVYSVTRGAYNGNPGYKVMEANPAVKIVRDSLAEYRQCCDMLGISPAARARLANMGAKGATPAQVLPGVGAKPTPLRVVSGSEGD